MSMKRGREENSNHFEKTPEQGRHQQPKRPKSSQACSSCRKHKTRCELLDGVVSGSIRCHRCKVLNLSCSFDNPDFPGPVASSSRESMPPPTPRPYIHHEERPKSPKVPPPDTPTFMSDVSEPRSPDVNIKPEDLVPRTSAPWGFLKDPRGHDWTVTPMLAMQELARRPHLGERLVNNDWQSVSLTNILTPDQIKYLLDIFESRYAPWINLPLNVDVDTPLVTLARCTVASRHLDAVTRSLVTPQLQQIVDSIIPKLIFHPMPTTESIQALLILSLWSPIGGSTHAEVRDGRLLAASAVSLAMNLRLSHASVYAVSLRDQQRRERRLSSAKSAELTDATDKARLWLSLTNAESLLCLGTGRSPLSQRSESDHSVIDSSSFSTPESGRDMRLGLMAQLFDTTEHAVRIRLASYQDMDTWYKEVLEALLQLDGLHRLISPLPVVVDHDVFHYHMLQVYYYACRLLVLHVSLRNAQHIVQREFGDKMPWYRQLQNNGVNIAAILGQDAMRSAEAVMVSMLSRPELLVLGTAPDNFFAMVSFAAAFHITSKFAIFQNTGRITVGSGDQILQKIIERLRQAAYSPDHTPAKCAQLITALVATWDMRTSNRARSRDEDGVSGIDHAISAERLAPARSAMPEPAVFPGPGQQMHDALPGFSANNDYNRFMNSDIFLDTDFWASFMDNLTTDQDM